MRALKVAFFIGAVCAGSSAAFAGEVPDRNAQMLEAVSEFNATASQEDKLTCRRIPREVLSKVPSLTCGNAEQWRVYDLIAQRQHALRGGSAVRLR